MPWYFLPHKLWDYPESMIFRQDGASPYYVNEVIEYLAESFLDGGREEMDRFHGSRAPQTWLTVTTASGDT